MRACDIHTYIEQVWHEIQKSMQHGIFNGAAQICDVVPIDVLKGWVTHVSLTFKHFSPL